MKAIILAAGIGKRLGEANKNKPKCLIQFAGKSLLVRHMNILEQAGVDEVTIVAGYQQQQIERELASVSTPLTVDMINNPEFEQGSVVSLWQARNKLRAGDEILLMDADVLYDPKILERLVDSENRNCFLLDKNLEPGDEPVKLCIKNDRIIEFRKVIASNLEYDLQGESVGFFKFSAGISATLADHCDEYMSNDRREEPYEEVIRDIILQDNNAFAFEDITGLPWIEIDFPQDIDRANREIMPELENLAAAT